MIFQITAVLTAVLMAVSVLITLNAMVKEEKAYERGVNGIEAVIVFVAFCFYLFIVSQNWSGLNVRRLRIRHVDWVITTPLMLIVLIMLYPTDPEDPEDPTDPEDPEDPADPVLKYLTSKSSLIITVSAMTILMVLVGSAMDTSSQRGKLVAVGVGFALLVGIFTLIYNSTGVAEAENKSAFWYTSITWGFYGLVYLLPTLQKNIAYNVLDAVAKPVFGMLLATKVFSVQER